MSSRAQIAVAAAIVLLIGTFGGAVWTGVFLFRAYSADDTLEPVLPEPTERAVEHRLTLRLIDASTVSIDGKEVPIGEMATRLIQLASDKNLMPADCTLLVQAPSDTTSIAMTDMIERCSAIGFERFKIGVIEE